MLTVQSFTHLCIEPVLTTIYSQTNVISDLMSVLQFMLTNAILALLACIGNILMMDYFFGVQTKLVYLRR